MKKHDWLTKTANPPSPDMGDKRFKKWQAEAFERVAADPGKQWREDGFDEVVSWERLSVRGKVVYLSWCAANYEVPYDRFARAVQDAVGEKGLAGGEGWTLQGLFDGDANEWRRPEESVRDNNLGQVPGQSPAGQEQSPKPEKNNGREL